MKRNLLVILGGLLVAPLSLQAYRTNEYSLECLERILAVRVGGPIAEEVRCPDGAVSLTNFDAIGSGGLVVDLIGALQAAYEKLSQTEKVIEEYGKRADVQKEELERLRSMNEELQSRVQRLERGAAHVEND